MQVTLISQCHKNALPRTRLVLDAFAERIGDNSWQTIITQQGLDALHTELRKTASKSTAVACHWQRSRTRSQLLWIVGKKHEFNAIGQVPVNETAENTDQFMDKEKWKTLGIMKAAAGIAGLFHDFGKANDLFQGKLLKNGVNGKSYEPLRHEWISLHLFQSFISGDTDEGWITRLEEITPNCPNLAKHCLSKIDFKSSPQLVLYPRFAQLVGWLILSHHRLPVEPQKSNIKIEYIDEWLEKNLAVSWNSPQISEDDEEERLKLVTTFSHGLPHQCKLWRRAAKDYAVLAEKALVSVSHQGDFLTQRFTSHLARLALMLSDHCYSSGPECKDHQFGEYAPIANLDKWNQPKQRLDEHNIGVAKEATKIIAQLPELRANLSELELPEQSLLDEKVSSTNEENYKKYGWQNDVIKVSQKLRSDARRHGFFGVNMASTGKGKTISNAKVLNALGSRRFNVALGLRTLTLQTGTSFIEDIKLPEEQVATLVGGIAVKELYELEKSKENELEQRGSASEEELTEVHVHSQTQYFSKHSLYEWTKHDERIEKLLSAPVLVSTIDHLIPATEGIRGGKQIGPMLRLLTSDLILDEPDDFGLEDLPALTRLVNWAGMLGSKVLLSSATLPPSLINALYRAYEAGRKDYLAVNGDPTQSDYIACAWFDEYHSSSDLVKNQDHFKTAHQKFVTKRIKNLKNEACRQRGALLPVEMRSAESPQEIISELSKVIRKGIEKLHTEHHVSHEEKTLSVGLVRMANLDPLVAVAKELFQQEAPQDTQIHYVVYHSRFPLAIRSHLESQLDRILSRKDEASIWNEEGIKEKLDAFPDKKHHVFVVLASPVAEVGRDHDYDWAVAEPSSMRSIIQLAGRVLRHRPWKEISSPNIFILQKNFKALKGVAPCFVKPGFESGKLRMHSNDLKDILPHELINVINSSERIRSSIKRENIEDKTLGDLEHEATNIKLLRDKSVANKWWINQPTWCGNLQILDRFRASQKAERYCLIMKDEEALPEWHYINPKAFKKDKIYELTTDIKISKDHIKLAWFDLSLQKIMKELYHKIQQEKLSYEDLSRLFSEVSLIPYNEAPEWHYHPQLGIYNQI